MWLGVDDTDGPDSGCTTFVLSEILAAARELGADILGEPRLIRLNPNVPFKTRGNAALSAHFGRGRGRPVAVGEVEGEPILAYPRGDRLSRSAAGALEEAAWRVVRETSADGPKVDPALVVADRRLPAEFYYRAVRTLVPIEAARRALDRVGAHAHTTGSEQGLVGAAAAIAWPGRRATWERIAYRFPERIGRARHVDPASVRRAQREDPRLFLCYDARTRRLLVAPHTRCPILYGIRATAPEALAPAARAIVSEPVERWVLFRTNQRTGDHLVDRLPGAVEPYAAARVRGRVGRLPSTGRGGHVAFSVVGEDGTSIDCLAFEPTKTLARAAAALAPDDRVTVWGGRGADPVLRVEGLRVERLSRPSVLAPPRCTSCGRHASSLGRLRGYRCPACRRRWPPEAGRRVASARTLARGTYHPTPSARRHLAPPGPEELGPVVDL